jgi:hypothetical protein
MKKQNIVFSIIGAVFMLLATSCSDFLQVSSVSLLQDKEVYSNPDSANQAIASIYDIIGQNNSYRNRLWLQMGLNTDIEYRPGWADSAKIADSKADDCLALERQSEWGTSIVLKRCSPLMEYPYFNII